MSRPLRFLILTQYFPPEVGAAQIRLFAFAKELQRFGHEVRVVTALPSYPRGEIFQDYRGRKGVREQIDGVDVTRTWIYPATGRGVLRRLLSYWSFAISSVPACMRGARPDFIFVESPPLFLGCTAYLSSRLRRIPFILNVSDLWPASAKELGIIRSRWMLWLGERMEAFLYRKAHRVTAVTEGIRSHVANAVGETKVMLLRNGVDTSLFRHLTNGGAAYVRPDEVAFMYAGTFGFAQGLEIIVEAAGRLRDRREIVFLLVGDGPERERLLELVRSTGSDNVRFVHTVPPQEMPALFSACRASIVPLRRRELFKGARPSKIFPSLACETPVVFCGEGEAAVLLEEHGCGIVVTPESAIDLAAAVARLADDPDEARQMGLRGRTLVEREYGWSSIVGEWLEKLPA